MAFKRAHARVGERSTTAGSGPWTLSGAFDSSYHAFSTLLSDGDSTEITVVENAVAAWTGIGTYTASTNSIAPTTAEETWGTFGSGTKEIFAGALASRHMLREDISGITTGGTSTAYTVTSKRGYASLAALDGQLIALTMHATSGAAPTAAIDGLAAKPLRVASGVSPQTGAFLAKNTYLFRYSNSDNELLALGQVALIAPGAVITTSIADANVTYAKIQNVVPARLLGNASGSPAAPAEIQLSGNLSFTGGNTLKGITTPFTIQRFLSGSGTYTTPAGCTAIRIRMIGGGAGGGGGNSSLASTVGSPTTWNVHGGANILTAGGGSATTATGGAGGGGGGSATGGNVASISGGAGCGGAPPSAAGGQGGSSVFGGAGQGAFAGVSSGGGGGVANSGGGGGGGSATTGGGTGGGGGAGGYVEHIISSPAASYDYAVGAGGAGATAGSTGGNGGTGASGIIIVEEYY